MTSILTACTEKPPLLMTRKLPADFSLDRYGVHVRLADVQDSEFILSLRTNETLARYIHATPNDIEKQRAWMREYKKREEEGKEYYFIYSYQNEDFGVNRFYNVAHDHATSGSWVCKQGIRSDLPILTILIAKEIKYDILNHTHEFFDVRKENKLVQKTHLLFGAKQIGETDTDYSYSVRKEDYYMHKTKILKILGLTQN